VFLKKAYSYSQFENANFLSFQIDSFKNTNPNDQFFVTQFKIAIDVKCNLISFLVLVHLRDSCSFSTLARSIKNPGSGW
jgi:hypothetical protein